MRLTISRWIESHRTVLKRGGIGLFIVLMAVQIFYPGSKLPLFANIDGTNVSGWDKKEAAKALNKLSAKQTVSVVLGNSSDTYDSATPKELGVNIDNTKRVEKSGYPFIIKLIPTSLFWYGRIQSDGAPEFKRDNAQSASYLTSTLGGESCNIPAKDASLAFKNDSLNIVGAKDGGTCNKKEAVAALASVKPMVGTKNIVRIPVDVKKPAVSDASARKIKDTLTKNSKGGIRIAVGDSERTIPQKDVLSWLSFSSNKNSLAYSIDQTKATAYFAGTITPLVTKAAGTTKIATSDFTVTSQETGATGQSLAITETDTDITKVLAGSQQKAKAFTTSVAPKVVYSRTYSKSSTGIAALLKFYDEDRGGVFGVSFKELGGRNMSAAHNESRRFTTASTYKLYVAYGTLRKIDDGSWKWSDSDISAGRNLSTCFDDMIIKSDNACAETLLKKLGYAQLTKDIQEQLGLKGSGFTTGESPHTTAADLTTYLVKLQDGSLPVKSESRTRLLDAMRKNVYRQGIPAGASGPVADKVGFLNALLHDAAIVYSPKGTYALTILTDGSSWAEIADLTKQIEALR